MTRGRYYSSVMPVAGILYVIALIVLPHHGTVAVVGAMCFALIAVAGPLVIRSTTRPRERL
jgi:hypothetical protein